MSRSRVLRPFHFAPALQNPASQRHLPAMRKVLLVVLDGWGHSDFEGPPSPGKKCKGELK